MHSLRLTLTICAAIFITTGVLAHSEDIQDIESPIDSTVNESSQVSAATAVSLFNFISLTEEKKDTTKTSFEDRSSSNKRAQVMEYFQTFF